MLGLPNLYLETQGESLPSETLSNLNLKNRFKPIWDLTAAPLNHLFPEDTAKWWYSFFKMKVGNWFEFYLWEAMPKRFYIVWLYDDKTYQIGVSQKENK